MSANKGVLLVNLGSPDSPAVGDVRRYLCEFLMDCRVLDTPWIIRFLVVHFLILPFRPKKSAAAYREVWLPDGSPLVVISRNVRKKLQTRIDIPIELAMRYQNPPIEQAVDNLLEHCIDEILLIPLFPHYAMSSYESAVEKTRSVLRKKAPAVNIVVQTPYFDHQDYIQALAASARETLDRGYDHLLFSFHGLPERQLKKNRPERQSLPCNKRLLCRQSSVTQYMLSRTMLQNCGSLREHDWHPARKILGGVPVPAWP